MAAEREDLLTNVGKLVDDYRLTCLWYLPRDFYPVTDEQIHRTLDRIEKHGDSRAFREAARLRRWLSRISSEHSVA